MTVMIYRYEVPVDDQWHEIGLRGDILEVGCRQSDMVEFWATHDTDAVIQQRKYVVVGTGQPWPSIPFDQRLVYRGTAQDPTGTLVWHLLEHVRWPHI